MHTQRAFTLVETLVAIAVLMVAVAGPLTIANKALRSALYARDQVVSNYLAQDALEMVKNIRDNSYLATGEVPWPPAAIAICESGPCVLDTTVSSPTASAVSGGVTGKLCNDALTGRFTHVCTGGNTPTIFTRTLQLTRNPNNTNEDTVLVTVVWLQGGVTSYEILRGSIYNAIR